MGERLMYSGKLALGMEFSPSDCNLTHVVICQTGLTV